MRQFLFCILLLSLFACNNQEADTIFYHAKIYTVDSLFTTVEAMAVKDGQILAMGTDKEIREKYKAKESIDLNGKPMFPGLIDAHAHFVGYGQSLFYANLYGTTSFEEAVERVKAFAAEHPDLTWIQGRGWDQNKWPGKTYPTNEILNKAFPDKPVILQRVDGHASIANQKALDLAGIKPGQTVVGGSIETINGKLTGVLIDNADNQVYAQIPAPDKAVYKKWLQAAQEKCFEQGLTTITDCGLSAADVDAIDALQKDGSLSMRLFVMLSDNDANIEKYLKKGPYKTDRLFVNGFKVYADGALGSRGACLLAPYADKAGWSGFLLRNPSHYDSLAKVLAASSFQMCTHAIGDSANRAILQIYNKYLQPGNDKRWRIEHAQIVHPDDFKLFGSAAIVPSVQPTHATSDMYWAEERLGKERLKGGYAYKQLLEQNGWLPLGTDFPVEDISPFKTFLAAVVRKDAKGFPAAGFQMENALTREQAIRGMTIWAAKAGFLEKEVGSLEKGKKADFMVLDQDLMTIADTAILNTKVLHTYIGGKRVN
ncbi:MAG: amidohydrolase [Bacteroidetes bacterium 24-39-8]|jgi:predicted amidohydrolase YtcJ|nr:MAG: amidohydrolase [Sphingobacteriia bacterium 35-40-8]OYZ51495.1 MAG: amidohydrolase [Bacteroidetes bacterium 24-39-8]OZA66222.1 MAG: amidohydrolase [Sphingobacteriia bacterium 39-39-8]HQR92469.1 amidohydrolase [Sediminibacterium sp.]HQS55035.1 amidohydrolase [Sediminibacterium sp.]